MKLANLLFLLLLLTSCSSFMDGMFKDLDRQERTFADEEENNSDLDQFDLSHIQ